MTMMMKLGRGAGVMCLLLLSSARGVENSGGTIEKGNFRVAYDPRGSIEPGKLADLTALSQDLMKIPVADIPKMTWMMTVINGEVVYDSGKVRGLICGATL